MKVHRLYDVGAVGGFDDVGEGVGVDAGAADEEAVGAGEGEDALDEFGFDAGAVEDAHLFGDVVAVKFGDLVADEGDGFLDLAGLGRVAGANGPDGFIGDDQAGYFAGG